MGDEPSDMSNGPVQEESWRVRIRGPGGEVLGAGVLLGSETVLTCAHVVPADASVLVDLVGVDGAEPVTARVIDECWVPERGDRLSGPSGDLALLRLDRPQPEKWSAVLHRLSPTWHRPVHTYGFPDGLNQGTWLWGKLAGLSGRDGRVQMFPVQQGEVVRPGFSGAAVTDELTGQVIGIVVGYYVGANFRHSYVIPTETVIRHLPMVRAWVHGDSAVDESLVSDSVQLTEDAAFATWLADWLRGGDAPPAESALVAPGDRARVMTLQRAVTLADRELSTADRTERVTDAPPGSVPLVGTLDLAVDVTRQSATAVAERVCGRMGIVAPTGGTPAERLRSTTLPLTIVADGVDRAPDPAALTELLELLAEQGSRVLMVFHTADEAVRRLAVEALVFRFRLGLLDRRLAGTADLGRRDLHDRCLLLTPEAGRGGRRALTVVHALRRHVATLRRAGSAPGRDAAELVRLQDEVDRCARTAAEAHARITRTIGRLDELLSRRDVLRGRLDAVRSMTRDLDAVEDLELADLYRRAHDGLWKAPCDVPAAEDAVARYLEAVRGRLDRGGRGADRGGGGGDRP
ncbi:trypsin-like peptidase domain-containing protein [Streptomyces sp. NPDC002018]|uniref:trypsin-like peptidase domain-containing protein n=1 Tax=Streptomyces sp. NPDC002018 TaxID=3364629 RepID=UPI003692F1D4